MGLKAQLGWIRHGASRTSTALASYEAELRELQLKVEALTEVVARLDMSLSRVDGDAVLNRAETARVEMLVEAMKEQLRTVTDDLGDRVGALTERLDRGATGG